MMPISVLTRNLNLDAREVMVYGSLQEGRADLRGGYRIDWRTQVWPFYLQSPVTIAGPDTRLTGALRIGLGGLVISGLEGRVGSGFLDRIMMDMSCETTVAMRDVGLGWGWRSAWAAGVVTASSGTCRLRGQKVIFPGLELELGREGADATGDLRTEDMISVMQMQLRRARVLELSLQPGASQIFPQLPERAPLRLTVPF